ncbi:MAG: hypothetical protein H0T46_30670, partial [Deltaproteobacteria bacterium]|nr:hypothetical protein [Deltaproteobacteria bacterium]
MNGARRVVLVMLVATASARAGVLSVSPPHPLDGDGRTVAPITITGGVAAATKELPVPEVPYLTCEGASGLAAVATQPPAVLAPVVTQLTTASCVAHLRDTDAPFSLTLRPPPPGLYARPALPELRTTASRLELDAFVWDGKVRAPPVALRAAASSARIVVQGGRVELELTGKAPRLLAIALADGERIGAAFVPVIGATTVPVEADVGAKVQMWIAGRWFGPVATAGRIGKVAIEVPPGITQGVARSISRTGYVTDAITDLKVPLQASVAAVSAVDELAAGEHTTIAIAVAGTDGRPAAGALPIRATARLGTVSPPEPRGGGLWSVRYTAPKTPGNDAVTIGVDGEASAFSVQLPFEISAGRPARITLEVPPGPLEPGAELAGVARVFDAADQPVPGATLVLTLGGVPLAVIPGDTLAFRGQLPDRVPPGGEVTLEARSGSAFARTLVGIRAPVHSLGMHTDVDGRRARADLVALDRFGNLVEREAFEVVVTGGVIERIEKRRGSYRVAIVAEPRASSARVVVRSAGRVVAEERLRFDAPDHVLVAGVWGSGAWVDNLGELASPRASIGLALRRGVAGVEVAASAGIEGLRFRDT